MLTPGAVGAVVVALVQHLGAGKDVTVRRTEVEGTIYIKDVIALNVINATCDWALLHIQQFQDF